MTRRKSLISPEEMGDHNIDRAVRPPKIAAMAKDDARALHILGGIYEAEAHELADAARTVRRIAPGHAPELLAILGLAGAIS